MITAKDIIRMINSFKFRHSGEELYALLDPDIYKILDEAGMIVRWQTNYPGCLECNENVCGIPCRKDENVVGFLVLTRKEMLAIDQVRYDLK